MLQENDCMIPFSLLDLPKPTRTLKSTVKPQCLQGECSKYEINESLTTISVFSIRSHVKSRCAFVVKMFSFSIIASYGD